jgi:adenosylhomocysteine nucleosidase
MDQSNLHRPSSRVAVVAAMEEELDSLRQRLVEVESLTLLAGTSTVGGRLGSAEVWTMATGEGSVAAERGLSALMVDRELGALLVVGVAGALSPDLSVGDLVAARTVRDGAREFPAPDPRLLQRALAVGGVVEGGVVSVERIVAEPPEKRSLWESLGERPFQVVDLESSTYARLAAERRVPFLVVRAVSDTASESLPLDFNDFRLADGRINRGKVARHLLFHPHLVGPLKGLRARLRECAGSMADVVEGILEP